MHEAGHGEAGPKSLRKRARVEAALCLLAAGTLLYLSFLGSRDLWYPDEPDVAEPAREMLERGDWVTPTHGGVPWIDYPPLAYWSAMASSLALGGMDEFSLRLPSALAALLAAFAVWRFGATRISPAAGFLAGLALLTFPHFVYQGTNVHPDMPFAAAQGCGLLLYVAAESWSGRRTLGRVLAFALFGLAVLAKGPLGLLLPGLVLVVWHLSRGEVRRSLLLAPLALVSLAVALPWYVAVARAQGGTWVWDEVLAQNLSRFGRGTERGHAHGAGYYLARLPADLGVWALPLLGALAWRPVRRLWADPVRRFALVWAVTMLVFFHLAATKREAYLLPAYPAFALLVGDLLATLLAGAPAAAKRLLRAVHRVGAGGALLAAAAAVLLAAAPSLWRDAIASPDEATRRTLLSLAPAGWAVALVALGAAAALVVALRREDGLPWAIGAAAVLHVGVIVVLLGWVQPRLDPVASYREPSRWLVERMRPGDALGLHAPGREGSRQNGFLFYGRMPLRRLPTADDLAGWLRAGPARHAVVEEGRALALLAGDARFAGWERRRFAVANHRWIVFGPPPPP